MKANQWVLKRSGNSSNSTDVVYKFSRGCTAHSHTHTCIQYNLDLVAFWPFIFPNAIHTCTNCIQSSRTYTLKKASKKQHWIDSLKVQRLRKYAKYKDVQTRRMDKNGNNTNNICLASDNQYHHTNSHTNAWLWRYFSPSLSLS